VEAPSEDRATLGAQVRVQTSQETEEEMIFPAWVNFVLGAAIAGLEFTQQYQGITLTEPVPFFIGLAQVVIGFALAAQKQITAQVRKARGLPA
jgi:hypothetical protein